jgi:hypothetical protein
MLINIFQKPSEKCPRCIGKGLVDNNDIKRLNKQLEWMPGKCAYCNGIGKVSKQTIFNIPADLSYLTLDRSRIERWKLKSGHKSAKKRAEKYQKKLNELTTHITKQYFEDGLDIETIADLHFARFGINNVSLEDKKDFINYIEKVININKNK